MSDESFPDNRGYVSFGEMNQTEKRDRILTIIGAGLALCIVTGVGAIAVNGLLNG